MLSSLTFKSWSPVAGKCAPGLKRNCVIFKLPHSLGISFNHFFKGVTAVHTPVSLSLASCHSMMVSMPHFVPMTHLFTKIQLPSYLSGNQWFSFKLWVLLYRALQFHMQGRVGKCNTWTRLHDCLCIPSWWKLCPLLQPSLFSTNRIFVEFTSSQ